ncbi:hypothetical protein O7599_15900 [Streptomyces sp. WMMC500]|uniref:hypothetical protein n=1 Tax=Streptomyces sp. WMMC500 TaxID=3015154 RepID=UPI00248AB2EC|nr:hypothetical protein [Streptomyces sp. WMMC500]WBB63907.1 hypothetical protein O7599_15900 [Streptomyces sp. WMMC500]
MSDLAWVPESCTLPTAERPLRIAEWDALFAEPAAPPSRPDPLRLRVVLAGGPGVEERVRELAARESGCCSFFTFATGRDEDDAAALLWLDIAVDEAHATVLDALAARIAAATAR